MAARFDVYPPSCARLVVHFPEGGRLWILNAASPISARQTRLFCPIARNFDKQSPVEEVYAFNLQIFNEDRGSGRSAEARGSAAGPANGGAYHGRPHVDRLSEATEVNGARLDLHELEET